MRNRPPNKILLKAPKKQKFAILQFFVVVIFIILIGFILNYFIFSNDLVTYPYFPSYGINLLNQGIAWLFALIIGCTISLFFISICLDWLKSYHRKKLIFYLLGSFLSFAAICFGIFFGQVAYKISYALTLGITSQLTKNMGVTESKKIKITAHIAKNLLYKQTIGIQRGKFYKHIIDPAAYKVQIQLNVNNHPYLLEPYCYTQNSQILALSSSSFTAIGQHSILGFRCTAQCELHAYFQGDDHSTLSSANFNQCSHIYGQQPDLD